MKKYLPILCIICFLLACKSKYPEAQWLSYESSPISWDANDINGAKVTYYAKDLVSSYNIVDNKAFFQDSVNGHILEKVYIEKADIGTLINLGAKYGKDKNNVYYKGKLVDAADPITFDAKPGGIGSFAKDSTLVFRDEKLVIGADSRTFRALSGYYYADVDDVFYYDGSCIEGANPKDVRVIKYDYLLSNGKVYYQRDEIRGADAATFQINEVDKKYSSDANNVYFERKVIENADPHTFCLLKQEYPFDYRTKMDSLDMELLLTIWNYATDRNHVFYKDKIVKKADPNTFRPFRYRLLCDSASLYYNGQYLFEVDTTSFTRIDDEVYMDDNYLYSIPDYSSTKAWYYKVDKESFKKLSDIFYMDKDRIFYKTYEGLYRFENVDIPSFRVICGEVAYDSNYIYFARTPMVFGRISGTDKEGKPIFEGGTPNNRRKLESPLVHLGDLFYRDKGHVYELNCTQVQHIYSLTRASILDEQTLEYIGDSSFKDKNGTYRWEDLKNQ